MISLYISMVSTDGEKSKIVLIYENYYSIMACTAARVLENNQQDVEDAVHSAMLKIIENIDIIDTTDERRLKNLCCVIAKNKAIDYLRSKKNEAYSFDDEAVFSEAPDTENDPLDIIVKQEVYDAVIAAIEKLPETYRDVCLLKYVSAMKESEISAILDITESNVGVRIHRAKQIIRNALKEENIYV